MKILLVLVLTCLLAACAAYDGRGLQPGVAERADVERVMGPPAMAWPEAAGGEKLAYPRGPAGFHTYMVWLDPAGRLVSSENVLKTKYFARIQSGMSQEDVLRLIGPPFAPWTSYFAARDELVWEWRWCDDWNEPARFNVLFDGTTGKVRSTGSLTEAQRFPSVRGRSWCSQ